MRRRVMALPDPESSTPRVLGVDDFATRHGQSYATVITDGERHHPIDVLPGRAAAPLAAWLTAHPGVQIICRDRAGAYADGDRLGAPDALRVADRCHLRQGLGRAVEPCVAAQRDCLPAPPMEPKPSSADMLWEPAHSGTAPPQNDSDRGVPDPSGPRAQRKKAAHAQVHELLAQGHPRRAIVRHVGWGLLTLLQ